MAGNTRGKLKEHFEGIHRNLEWCVQHINKSLTLIETSLSLTEEFLAVKGDTDAEQKVYMKHPMYQACVGMGEVIKTADELAQGIYKNI